MRLTENEKIGIVTRGGTMEDEEYKQHQLELEEEYFRYLNSMYEYGEDGFCDGFTTY